MKNRSSVLIVRAKAGFIPLLFLSILACASSAAGQDAGIRRVDFKNFTFLPFCAGNRPQKVTVRNGEFARETPQDGYVDRFYFTVESPVYGDVDGDGANEAVVISYCNTGGTGNFSEGFIYKFRRGSPALIGRIPGGDRAYGGLRSVTIGKGVLTVETNDTGANGGACCPEYAVTTRYKLNASKLVAIGKLVRRELYPKQRLTFDRGASSKTFAVRIDPSELKRYTIGARAGQVISVSVNTDKASLRLLDDAAVTESENGFTAKLPKTSDYSFEILNNSDAPLDLMVSIQVK